MNLEEKLILSIIVTGLVLSPFSFLGEDFISEKAEAGYATTSVMITVCGNGTIEAGELCDDGVNNGTYGSSASNRYCNTKCDGWAPYCGDGIYNQEYGEECDDGNNSDGDGCSSSCTIETGGGGGGGPIGPYPEGQFTPPPSTGVVVRGKAYPGAEVNILKEGELIGVTNANSQADFVFSDDDVTPGVTTFGFWAEDSHGIRSIFITVTFQIIPDAVTTISGILLPPTITTDKTSVEKGETINILGQTVPNSNVYVHIASPSEIIKEVNSSPSGDWSLAFETDGLEENKFHTVKALFQTGATGEPIKSGFSKFVSFYVGEGVVEEVLCAGADLNQDGKVNLADFSILLFHWGSANACADQNRDGIVNLADFSIMMYHWTG